MQLSVPGHPLHTRALTLVVSQREDGRLRARGDVTDLRKCGFVPLLSGLQPAGIIHQMWIDLVVDPGTRRIDALETGQPFVAVEPSAWSEGECCRDPAPRLQALVGETLDPGFAKRLSAVFGGPRGCSHLLSLFQLMATALPRALAAEAALRGEGAELRGTGERIFWRSLFLDGAEGSDGSIELALQLHDFHGRPDAGASSPLDRFGRHDELRVSARVERPSLRLSTLHAGERVRERSTLANDAWTVRDAEVAALVGQPIIPGLARRVFDAVEPASALLRDALLQLAPGYIQVMAAITDRWFVQASEADVRDPAARDRGPQVAALGGMADSCYMWRADGPLARSRWNDPQPGSTSAPAGRRVRPR